MWRDRFRSPDTSFPAVPKLFKTEIHHNYSMPLAKPQEATLLTLTTDLRSNPKRAWTTGTLPYFISNSFFIPNNIYHPAFSPNKKQTSEIRNTVLGLLCQLMGKCPTSKGKKGTNINNHRDNVKTFFHTTRTKLKYPNFDTGLIASICTHFYKELIFYCSENYKTVTLLNKPFLFSCTISAYAIYLNCVYVIFLFGCFQSSQLN